VLIGVTVIQGVIFQLRFHENSAERSAYFDAEFPRVLSAAEAVDSGPIYSIDGTSNVLCLWYSALEGRDRRRCVGSVRDSPPPGGVAISQLGVRCNGCRALRKIGTFLDLQAAGERLDRYPRAPAE
jgi:hypothetical protein